MSTKSYAMETRDRLVEAGNFADADTDVDDVVQIIEDDEREINRLEAENAKMRKVLDKASDTMRLVIESAEDVMQPHLVQEICHCGLAIEKALATEGETK